MTAPLKVNASELYRIMACVGSIGLTRQVTTEVQDNEAAEEGTAAHWLAHQMLTAPAPHPQPGDKAPNGYIINSEMIEHAASYAERVKSNVDVQTLYEAPLHWSYNNTVDIRVRADVVAYAPAQKALAIVDFKYGHRVVEPQENWQLIAGAIGSAFALEGAPERYHLAIYQPRAPHPDGPWRTWTITSAELVDRHNILARRFANITDELVTGPHCRYCRAAPVCPAAQRAGYNAVDVAMNSGSITVNDDGLRGELEILERAEEVIKQRRAWLEGHALARLRDGVTLPGLYAKRSLGHATWVGGIGQIETATGMSLTEPKPITPAEAKRRGMTKEQIEQHTHRPELGVKLGRGDIAKAAEKAFK